MICATYRPQSLCCCCDGDFCSSHKMIQLWGKAQFFQSQDFFFFLGRGGFLNLLINAVSVVWLIFVSVSYQFQEHVPHWAKLNFILWLLITAGRTAYLFLNVCDSWTTALSLTESRHVGIRKHFQQHYLWTHIMKPHTECSQCVSSHSE